MTDCVRCRKTLGRNKDQCKACKAWQPSARELFPSSRSVFVPADKEDELAFQVELGKFSAWLDEQKPVLENLFMIAENDDVTIFRLVE